MHGRSRPRAGAGPAAPGAGVLAEQIRQTLRRYAPALVGDRDRDMGRVALQFLKRGQVLHGDHHGGDGAVPGLDRRRVDQRGDAAPVRRGEDDLLGAHRLGAAQHERERELGERDLAPVGEAAGEDVEQVLDGTARHAKALHDAPGLAVERDRAAAAHIAHRNAHR